MGNILELVITCMYSIDLSCLHIIGSKQGWDRPPQNYTNSILPWRKSTFDFSVDILGQQSPLNLPKFGMKKLKR